MTVQLQTRNILRVSPRIILIASLLVYLVSNDYLPLRFTGYLLVTELTSVLLKLFSGALTSNRLVYRPHDSGDCMGCGTYFAHPTTRGGYAQLSDLDCPDASHRIGMPSGHSMTMVMAATFWSLWIFKRGAGSTMSKAIRSTVLILLALAVVVSRTALVENCHTVPQVLVGSVIGIALGYSFYHLETGYVSVQELEV